jgi:hypothetical protein
VRELLSEVDRTRARRFVLDLRYNCGGDGSKMADLVHEFVEHEDAPPWQELDDVRCVWQNALRGSSTAEPDCPERRTADMHARPDPERHGQRSAKERQGTTRLPREEPWVRNIARGTSRPLDSSTVGDEGGGGW